MTAAGLMMASVQLVLLRTVEARRFLADDAKESCQFERRSLVTWPVAAREHKSDEYGQRTFHSGSLRWVDDSREAGADERSES